LVNYRNLEGDFATKSPLDLNELRARLRRMSEKALKQFGAEAR
jgi:hypothetical protein